MLQKSEFGQQPKLEGDAGIEHEPLTIPGFKKRSVLSQLSFAKDLLKKNPQL